MSENPNKPAETPDGGQPNNQNPPPQKNFGLFGSTGSSSLFGGKGTFSFNAPQNSLFGKNNQ